MNNTIQLLPDAVANQIAAGEVVQRPASVVKELLENSIDAGATSIKLVVRDAGKSLIQVIDDGKGMSETDARLAFERHATSKIRKAEDLFRIITMGFRGEALASIAAVAQVECKTKQDENDLGTELKIEGSKVISQNYCQCATGTVISVKNLFFNIPARRNFLKSDKIEFKHIIDEFERIALANPQVELSLTHNQNTVFQLPVSNLRQRITGIFGKKFNERLVPVEESTDIVKLTGFTIKPEYARKTRGEQFFFVNNRFIRNHYLHHAIGDAFEALIAPDLHPGYFLFMEIDPARIDVNIHPTKTEIKFDDEKSIYAIIRVSVKHALGQFNVAPAIDFERETAITIEPLKPGEQVRRPGIIVNPDFNPFTEEEKGLSRNKFGSLSPKTQHKAPINKDWEKLFVPQDDSADQLTLSKNWDAQADDSDAGMMQLFGNYIAKRTQNNLLLIHQQRAHERILYERFIQIIANQSGASQQLLFPQQLALPAGDIALLQEYMEDLAQLGFDIEVFGQSNLVIQGIPFSLQESESLKALEDIVEAIKNNSKDFKLNKAHQIALVLARNGATKSGKALGHEEMLHLADQLFACEQPQYTPTGKAILVTLSKEFIDKEFN
jgi:DNA mismatch repair protein MutL